MEKCPHCANWKDNKCSVMLLAGCSDREESFEISAMDLSVIIGHCVSFVQEESSSVCLN